ncbi:RIB43A-like with coiled-coils protein 2 [Halichondria panicea]|uniref:RIB43A-like with coiled-coils protein 2 n=1 Tax=Halichondria panicea TaxID=6063 RepID=UPI00312B5DCB
MYKLDIRVDTKESAAVERRRITEQQRQSRIFNARERTIGLDTNVLSEQMAKRKQDEDIEKQRTEAHAAEMTRADRVTVLLQERQDKDIRKINEGVIEYRKEHQRVRDRREFDLYDPDSLKKDLPARVSDEDPRLTISGVQVLSGEDLMSEKRKKLQQEQTREWTSQQKAEKERLAMEEREANRLYELKACEMDQRAVKLAMAEEEARKALNTAQRDYNLALAKEKAALQQQERAQEEDDNFTEMCNNVHGDILTENPDVAQSAFGSHRVIPDRWKGMSPSQIEEIRMTQEAQKQERAAQAEQERVLAEEWDRRRVVEAKARLILESQEKRRQKELALKLAEENRQLAASQRASREYLSKHVYVNSPTKDYFAQFNTSSR